MKRQSSAGIGENIEAIQKGGMGHVSINRGNS